MFDLTGKRALVTGASRGAGVAIARALAAAGAEVALAARNEAALAETKAGIEGAGGRATVHAVDLASREDCRRLAAEVGEIDILINNAALTVIPFVPVLETDEAVWDRSYALNVTAPMLLMKAFGRGMAARRRGVIINISSVGGQRPVPCHAAYASSKAALEMLSRAAALDLAPSNVRVVAVAFGLTNTEALEESCAEGVTPDDVKGLMPINRLIEPAEMGYFCRYLASDEAGAITGVVLNIDGGQTAGQFAAMGSWGTRQAQETPTG